MPAQADAAQQLLLQRRAVAQHPLVPDVVDGVQGQAEVAPQAVLAARQERQGVSGRQRGLDAALDPGRGDRAGRVDPHPAAPVEPDLGPGVGVGLADDHVVAQAVDLAAQVAGHHPGRHPGRAHQGDEAGRIHFAEPGLDVEQELVDRVASEQRRVECVDKAGFAEHAQGALDDLRRRQSFAVPARGQRQGARVVAAW